MKGSMRCLYSQHNLSRLVRRRPLSTFDERFVYRAMRLSNDEIEQCAQKIFRLLLMTAPWALSRLHEVERHVQSTGELRLWLECAKWSKLAISRPKHAMPIEVT